MENDKGSIEAISEQITNLTQRLYSLEREELILRMSELTKRVYSLEREICELKGSENASAEAKIPEIATPQPAQFMAPQENAAAQPVQFMATQDGVPAQPIQFMAPQENAAAQPVQFMAPQDGIPAQPVQFMTPQDGAAAQPVQFMATQDGIPAQPAQFMTPQGNAAAQPGFAGAYVQQAPVPVTSENAPKMGQQMQVSMEGSIGKTLMSISAAVLILFSIVLFGGLLIPYVDDVVKLTVMYLVDVIFAAAGILYMKKNSRLYPLFSAIAAVGVSGFYITNLIGCYGFNIISPLTTMILIAAWIIMTVILAKVKSRVFVYISDAGLVIASILATDEWRNIYISVFLYIIGIAVLLIFNRSKNYNHDGYLFIQTPVIFMLMMLMYNENWQLIVFAGLMAAMFVLSQFMYRFEQKHLAIQLVALALTAIASLIICLGLIFDKIEYFSIFAAEMIIIAAVMKIKHGKGECRMLSIVSHYIMIASLLTVQCLLYQTVGYLPVALCLLLIGFINDDPHFKYPGYAYLALFTLVQADVVYGYISFAFVFVMIILILIQTFRNYNALDKYFSAALMLVLVFRFVIFVEASASLIYMLVGILCIYANSGIFIKNFRTKEPEFVSLILAYIFNGIMMVTGLAQLLFMEDAFTINQIELVPIDIAALLQSLMLLVLCIMNVKRILNSSLPKPLSGIYTCFKFTVLLVTVLFRMRVVSYGMTLAVFLLAAACIIVGFFIKYRSFRIYGLVLSLLMVLKLVLADIEYTSDILRPIGFLAAGLVCFGISWVYTLLEKQQKIQ